MAVGRLLARAGRGLPVGAGGHDQPVHGLDAPSSLDELGGQPVQQFGMGRGGPQLAEVAGRGHQAPAEVMLPDAVHHHPGRQGMIGLSQPPGQGQTPSAAPFGLGDAVGSSLRLKRRRDPGIDEIAGAGMLPPNQQVVRRGFPRHVEQGPDGWMAPQLLFGLLHRFVDLARLFSILLEALLQLAGFHREKLPEGFHQVFLQFAAIVLGDLRGSLHVRPQCFRNLFPLFPQQSLPEGGRLFFQRTLQTLDLLLHRTVVPLHLPKFFLRSVTQQPFGEGATGRRQQRLLGDQPVVGIVGRAQDGAEAIEVALGERVVLMIVAAGAGQGQAHHRRAQHLDLVGHHVQPLGDEVLGPGPGAVGRHAQEAGGDQRFHLIRSQGIELSVVHQLVARDLLQQKAVVGLVVVEGSDDVVPVAVGMGPQIVGMDLSFRVGVPGGIQPVAAPAFPVVRGIQQPVDQPFIGLRVGVPVVGPDLVGGGGQAHQVQVGPAHQGQAVGRGSEAEPAGLQLFQQKGVDRVPDPLALGDTGRGRPSGRLQGPELRGFLLVGGSLGGSRGPVWRAFRGSVGNPAAQFLQLGRGDGADAEPGIVLGRRHLLGLDALQQQTLFGLAGNHGRPRLSPLQDAGAGAQVQAGFPGSAAVADQAAHVQDWHQHVVAGDGGFQVLSGLELRGILAVGQGALVDPVPNAFQFAGFQRILAQRHFPRLYLLKKQALLGRSRNDRWPRGPALEKALQRAQVELTLPGLRTVASLAPGFQQRQNSGLEAWVRVGICGRENGAGYHSQAGSQQRQAEKRRSEQQRSHGIGLVGSSSMGLD